MMTMKIAEEALTGMRLMTHISNGSTQFDGFRFGPLSSSGNHLVVSQDGSDVLLAHGSDEIRVFDMACNNVANKILAFSERLKKFDSDLNTLVLSSAPLQALVDRGLEQFRNPIFIIDETNTIRARTNHPPGTVNDDWDYIVQFNRMPIERVRAIYNSNQVDWFSPARLTAPFLFSPPGMTVRAINFRIPSADRSKFIGTLIIIEHDTSISDGMLQYASILAQAVVKWVQKHHDKNMLHATGDMLVAILNGDDNTEEEAFQSLKSFILPYSDAYIMAAITSGDATRATHYLHLVEESVPHCICCSYNGDLALLFSASRKDEVLSLLSKLFVNIPISVGVSCAFSDLSRCGSSLTQAQIATRCGNDKISELNAESVMNYIVSETASALHAFDLIHPALRRLKEYDAKHKTRMYETLNVFLRNERSLAKTLRALNIHRNSLIYRLERIGQIADYNPDDPDEREWLLFSFHMDEGFRP